MQMKVCFTITRERNVSKHINMNLYSYLCGHKSKSQKKHNLHFFLKLIALAVKKTQHTPKILHDT